jgi:hypothetical protein
MKEPFNWKIGDFCFCRKIPITDNVEHENEHCIPGVIQSIKEGKAHFRFLNGKLSCENLTDIQHCAEEAFHVYVFNHRNELEKAEEAHRKEWSRAFAAVHEFNGLLKGIYIK